MVKYTPSQIAALDRFYASPGNLVDLFEESARRWPAEKAIGTKNPQTKQYEWATYGEIQTRIDDLRGGLKKLGLKKGDTIGAIVSNSVEWFVIENATHGIGGRFVALYEKDLLKTWAYIISDSRVTCLFVRDEKILEKIRGLKPAIETLQDAFVIYGQGRNSLPALERVGRQNPVESCKPHWSEIANIIYTSGTTGDPKGVLLSHGNLTACSRAGYQIFPQLEQGTVSLAILPWAHSYGISAELHNAFQFGGAIGLMESVDTLGEDLQLVNPSFLVAVPRVFNKIYDSIQAAMEAAGGLKKFLFEAACRAAVGNRSKAHPSLRFKILDRLVFSKIRVKFGNNIKGVMTASAVMNPDIALFFKDIGIPTYDCYGMTETAPAITMNSPLNGNRYGSVGRCVANMHVKIDRSRINDGNGDGEIVAYGAHVMMGYLNKPEETAAVMTTDTWNGFYGIRTGDRGYLDEDGYLYVTGRFKDAYKLSNGKYVHPESIETDLKLLKYVANAMLYGDGRGYNVAVVVPDFEVLRNDPQTAGWASSDPDTAASNPELIRFLESKISAHLQKTYTRYEVPRKFIFTGEDFTVENGMITQTMKVKRREVMAVYGNRLEQLYTVDLKTPNPS